jgi:hypothetical protein
MMKARKNHGNRYPKYIISERTSYEEERFVFVCTGNTCRSPMAEVIFRKLLARRALVINIPAPQQAYMLMMEIRHPPRPGRR